MRTLNINLNAPPSPFALDEAASADQKLGDNRRAHSIEHVLP